MVGNAFCAAAAERRHEHLTRPQSVMPDNVLGRVHTHTHTVQSMTENDDSRQRIITKDHPIKSCTSPMLKNALPSLNHEAMRTFAMPEFHSANRLG